MCFVYTLTLNIDLTRSAAVKSDECTPDVSVTDTIVIPEYVKKVSSKTFILHSKRTRQSRMVDVLEEVGARSKNLLGNRWFILHHKWALTSCARITTELG